MSQVIAGIICLGIFGGPAAFVVIKGVDQSERAAAASEKGWEYIGVGTVIAVLGILLRWLLFSEWATEILDGYADTWVAQVAFIFVQLVAMLIGLGGLSFACGLVAVATGRDLGDTFKNQ